MSVATGQVEELRQQVQALQEVGYGLEDSGSEPSGGIAGKGKGASLEALLLAKARRLEHDLTMARLRLASLAGAAGLSVICIGCCIVSRGFSQPEVVLRALRYKIPNHVPDKCMLAGHTSQLAYVRQRKSVPPSDR